MSEMEDKIKDLLSSPDGLNNILSIIKSLSGSSQQDNKPGASPAPASVNPSDSNTAATSPAFSGQPLSGQAGPNPVFSAPASQTLASAVPALSSFPDFSALTKLDPRVVTAAMNVIGEYTHDDDRILLLNALKPHLRTERRDRIDKAAQILRITKSIRAAMNGLSLGGKTNV